MRDLRDNAAGRSRIGPGDRLIELGDPEALNDLFLLFRVADHAPVILDLDHAALFDFLFLNHNFNGTPPSWRHFFRSDTGVPLNQFVDLLAA